MVRTLFRNENWLAGLILLAAFAVRIWQLDMKPPHFDEGINGHFVMQMWREGYYRYDPTNFHGPLYFYVLQLSELLLGRGIFAFRFATVLISVLAVGVTLAHRRFFGSAAIWAALVLALSPAGVFYARYAIHEWLFIFLQIVFSYGYFLYREERSRLSVALMTVGIFGSFATKETFFVFFVTWLIAIAVDPLFEFARKTLPPPKERVGGKNRLSPLHPDTLAIVVIGGLATLALFSGFFLRPQGLFDMVRALMVWTKTGTGTGGHDKSFLYWIEIMWRYEWPLLLALIVSPAVYFLAAKPGEKNQRELTLVAFGIWLAYSLIPYKTPWLILNPEWPLAFVFGFGMVYVRGAVVRFGLRPLGFVYSVLAIFAIGISGQKMFDLVYVNFVNPREPYVYVQSTMEFKRVMDWIEARVRAHPEDLNMKLKVTNRDTWPMPWTLSEFPNLSWGSVEDADVKGASVILIDAKMREPLETKLVGRYLVQPFKIRDAYDEGWAYFRADQFTGIIPQGSAIVEEIEP